MSVGPRRVRYLGYVALSGAAVAVYALAVLLALFSVIDDPVHVAALGFPVLIVVLVAEPARHGCRLFLDRLLFRDGVERAQALRDLGMRLIEIAQIEPLLEQLTSGLNEALDLTHVEVWRFAGKEVEVWRRPHGGPISRHAGDEGHRRAGELLAHGRRGLTLEHAAQLLGAELQPRLPSDPTLLLLPLLAGERCIGLLVLGGRRYEHSVTIAQRKDIEAIAGQTAIALQNAEAFERLRELERELERRVAEQTAQLQSKHQQLASACDELRASEAQLLQSEKMASLGQLVAGVAHELNTPVSFVAGSLTNLELYVERFTAALAFFDAVELAGDDAELRREEIRAQVRLPQLLEKTPALLRICGEGAARIRAIVRSLNMFSHADGDGWTMIEIDAAIDAALRLLDLRIGRQGVEIVRAYAADCRVYGSPAKLGQVWLNLLANALDAVEGLPHPRIEVSVQRIAVLGASSNDEWLEIQIADNGVGIRSEVAEHMFTPFYTTKPLGKGTGLGLGIVSSTVAAHRGTVTLKNRAAAHGAVVTVHLPVV